MERPNILVILTDDHGRWCNGCYGNTEVQTPALDRLAARGVRMDQAYCVTPVCSPSRATFHTGLMPSQHGIHDYIAEAYTEADEHYNIEAFPTIASQLSAASYHCAFSGKWHCGRPERPQAGYHDWFANWRQTVPHRRGAYSDNGARVEIKGYKTDVVATRAIQQIRSREQSKPYFGFVGFVATHSPWADQPERLLERYRNATFADIPQDPIYPDRPGVRRGSEGGLWPARRSWHENYYAAATHIDEHVARIIDELEAQEMLDNTLVVYTSDHGLLNGQYGMWGKGNSSRPYNMLEDSIRIPLIFGGHRDLPGGVALEGLVDHTDLFTTLLDFAGVALPDGRPYPGRSYARALRGGAFPADSKPLVFGEYGDLRMARSATHKLIRRHGRGIDEFYDLGADPRESHNRIDDPACAAEIARLDEAIRTHFARYCDPARDGLRVTQLPPHNPVEAWRGDAVPVQKRN